MKEIEKSEGYKKLLAAVEKDEAASAWHNYRAKLKWVLDRALHYAEQTGLDASDILDAWESKRNYWYMNYYQDSNQPMLCEGKVRVFDTTAAARSAIGKQGFRCPSCGGVSKNPSTCDTGITTNGKPCDWKAYGLFRTMGKGCNIFVKEDLSSYHIFMPVAFETEVITA